MIIKFQLGGGALPPLVSYQPVTISGAAAASTAAAPVVDKTGKSDLTDKDLLEMLKGLDGLPSDTSVLIKQLLSFYVDSPFKPNTSNITSRYLTILGLMKNLNFNHQEYKDAFKTVNTNGGINEVAINDRGLVFCVNKYNPKDFLLISPEELFNQDKYIPLTNADLLNKRAYDIDLANNSNILKVVKNGLGMDSVNKLINQAVTFLGSNTLQQDNFIRSDGTVLLSGLQDYVKAAATSNTPNMSINNLFKLNELTKSQAEQAKKAINYIWSTLPITAKTLLKTKTANGTAEEAKLLIEQIITSRTSDTHLLNVTIGESDSLKNSKKAGSKNSVKNDPVKAFILGKGNQQPIGISVGNSYKFTINGRYSVLVDKSGKALGANSTLEDVSGSAFAGILDINLATFGGVKLNSNQGRKVLLDSSDIIGMDLPIDQNAFNRGIIRPDLNLLKRLELADTQIREENITNPVEINKIYVANNLPEKFKNEDGTYKMNTLAYQRFARLSGVVAEAALPKDIDLDETVLEITDDNFRDAIEEVLKSKDKNYTMSDGFLGMGVDEIFRGAIYIPVREDLIAASLGSGDYYELEGTADATEIEEKWDQTQKIQSYVKAPSLGILK